MLTEFMNGFNEFKEECENMSEEEFLAPFFEMGIEFVPIEETKTQVIDQAMLEKCILFIYSSSNAVQKQLIA